MRGLQSIPRTLPRVCLRILIADDDAMVRVALLGLLKRLGHETLGVSNGLEAVKSASAREFDIVILDMQMPGMDGQDAAARILQCRLQGSPRLVGLSAEPMPDNADLELFDAFLTKPVCLTELSQLLDRLGQRALPDSE